MKSTFFWLIFPCLCVAQTKGIVKDSLSGLPIPYANIWVEDENIGTNSESDGTFYLDLKTEKNLIFSALGYETKKVNSSIVQTVLLQPKTYFLEEVVVEKTKNESQKKIGNAKQKYYKHSFQNTSQVYGKVFNVGKKQLKTPFLSKVEIFTHSNIDSARFRLRIMDLDENGFPNNDLLQKEIIVFVKKGFRKTVVDLKAMAVYLTDEKVFVGFQSLIIQENKYKFDVDKKIKLRQKAHQHEPSLIINPSVEGLVFHSYQPGKWSQIKVKNRGGLEGKIASPAINIVLSD